MRDHPWPGAWSASQYLVHVAQVAEVTAKGVVRLLADDPAGNRTQEAPKAPGGSRSRPLPAAVLASIGASIEQLASTAELIASDDWRIGIRRHGELPSLELIRLALHEATHHLVEAAQVLEQVRRHPAGTSGGGAVGIAFSATVSDDGGRSQPRPRRSTRRPKSPRYRSWQW